MIKSLLLCSFFCFSTVIYGQLVEFSFQGSSGNEITYPPDFQPQNGSVSDIIRGSGISPSSSAGEFSSRNWSTAGLHPDDYYSFSIESSTGFNLTLTRLSFKERRSGTGIRALVVRSSIDNFVSNLLEVSVPDNSNVRTNEILLDGNYANLPSGSAMEFRIYGYQSESSSGTWWVDDIVLEGSIAPPDNIPPEIVEIEVIPSSTLIVSFSEEIHDASIEVPQNTVLNGTVHPQEITRQSGIGRFLLSFPETFSDGQNQLKMFNISDLAGNQTLELDQTFSFIADQPAKFKDLVINEIMADPTPVVGLPDIEYVEILNESNYHIDIQNYSLNGEELTDDRTLIAPLEYLILTDQDHVDLFVERSIGIDNMGALTNTGELLILKDENNDLIIDSLTYRKSWYNNSDKGEGGYSLERIGVNTGCDEQFYWSASLDPSGGTPGSTNSVETLNPFIPDIELKSYSFQEDTLYLEFSDPIPSNESAQMVQSESLTLSNLQISTDRKVYKITFDNLPVGISHTVELVGFNNCDGSLLSFPLIDITKGKLPAYHDLIITEIMASPTEEGILPDSEYLEIYNSTDKIIDLNGLLLSDAVSTTIIKSGFILPESYALLAPNGSVEELSVFGEVIGVSNWPTLNKTSDLITLSIGNEIIFSTQYYEHWYKDQQKAAGGWSLEMVDLGNPCGEEHNWTSSEDANQGTPGNVNSVNTSNPDQLGPQILEGFFVDQHIQINFNEKISPEILSTTSSITPLIQLGDPNLVRPEDQSIFIEVLEEIQSRQVYSLQLDGLSDCVGNSIDKVHSNVTVVIPEEADRNDLIINEILFNPPVGGVDFVELFNRSPKHINLKDWSMLNQNLDTVVITRDNKILSPGKYLVLSENPESLMDQCPHGNFNVYYQTDLPTLPDRQGSFSILNPHYNVIDSLSYLEDQHFALLNDHEGVSLERISPITDTNDRDNWGSASSSSGFATPGMKNSQSINIESEKGAVIVQPQIIFPNNDGYNDFAVISYSFDKGNNVANIDIFDALGRSVKRITENETLSTEGFFTWDGTNDNLQKVRLGYYIIQFEIFDLEGRVRVWNNKIVVANR